MSYRQNRARALVAAALMIVPLFTAAAPLAEATTTPTASCSYGSGDVCLQEYTGPDGLTDATGETTLGVDPLTGAVMFSAQSIPSLVSFPTPSGQQLTARVTFDDATTPPGVHWADVTNRDPTGNVGMTNTHANLDPMLWTDTSTGRTVAGADSGSCQMSYSMTDDDGATWNPIPSLGCTGVEDHPTIGSGPYHGSPPSSPGPTGTYPRVFYVCQQQAVALCVTSTDGAQTFGAPVSIGASPCVLDPGTFGHLRVGVDGTAYVALPSCDTWAGGSKTQDNGQTWHGFDVPGLVSGSNFDTSVAPGRGDKVAGGRLYYVGNTASGHAGVATSDDGGATWTAPVDLNAASARASGAALGVKTATFTVAIAGDDDRAAVTFLGTKDSGNGFDCSFTGAWYLYVAYTYDGGRTWTSYDAGNGSPVQIGGIWPSGGASNCRNLFDFDDIVMAPDGRVLIGFSDACIPADGCGPNSGDSTGNPHNSQGSISRQYGGRGLLASQDVASGNPAITVSSPGEGASVPAASLSVTGGVSRTGGVANEPPTGTIVANQTTGRPPLDVAFTLAGADADGSVASWTLDFGDATAARSGAGAPPATVAHAYALAGTFVAKLTLTDDRGAKASVTTTIVVSSVPMPAQGVSGSVYIYDGGRSAAGQQAQPATAIATGQPEPVVVAGELVSSSTRTTTSSNPGLTLSATTTGAANFYDASGALVLTLPVTCGAETAAIGSGWDCSTSASFPGAPAPAGVNLFQIPADWSGLYTLQYVLTQDGHDFPVFDASTPATGVHVIQVVNPQSPQAATGHDIKDKLGDQRVPALDLAWSDAALVHDQLVVTVMPRLLPDAASADGLAYVLHVNGARLGVSMIGGAPSIYDLDHRVTPTGSVAWNAGGMLVAKIDRTSLRAMGADCPCALWIESTLAGVVADRAPDAGRFAVPMGSASTPDATDPSGDIDPIGGEIDPACGIGPAPCVGGTPAPVGAALASAAPWADVTGLWVSGETPTRFDVTLQVASMESMPESPSLGDPTGLGLLATGESVSFNAEFCLDNNPYISAGGSGGSHPEGFCYQVSAVDGIQGVSSSAGVVQDNGSDTCGIGDVIDGVDFDTAAGTVTWHLLRAGFLATQNSASVQTCTGTTSYPVLGGTPLVDGTTLSRLKGFTGVTTSLAVAASTNYLDQTDGNSQPYLFGDHNPLAAGLGGPYAGVAGAIIPISANVAGGHAPYSCTWTAPGATIGDAHACVTTLTYATSGVKPLSLSVLDGHGETATASGSVTVSTVSGERVDVYVDAEAAPRAGVAVHTNASSPTASFAASVDLSDLSGPHTITAKWIDADGAVLATKAVDVDVAGGGVVPYVTIEEPANDANGQHPVSGVTPLAGSAGHQAPGQPSGMGLAARQTSPRAFAALAATTVQGLVAAPCVTCRAGGEDPSFSVDWRASGVEEGETGFGVDGVYLDVTGYAGGAYRVSEESGTVPQIFFYNQISDATYLAANRGTDPIKTGTVPAGANYAFVYLSPITGSFFSTLNVVDLELSPPASAPGLPTGLAAVGGANQATLTWTAPADDGGAPPLTYNVYRDGGQVATGVSATTYTDTGLLAAHTYQYAVEARNAAGLTSGRTASVAATTSGSAPNQPPSQVTGLTATSAGTSSIQLSWSAATDDVGVDHYEVRRDGGLVGTPTGTSFTDGGLAANTTYSYTVTAVDGQGAAGPASAGASATTDAIVVGGESVALTLDGAATPFATVGVANGAWSGSLDTTALSNGAHTLSAAYDDGAGGSATATSTFYVSNGAGIRIDAPAQGATVHRPIEVTGTTSGGSGANVAQGTFASSAIGSPQLAALRAALAHDAGYLGAYPALDGSQRIVAYFSGEVPADLHQGLVPWPVEGQRVSLVPAMQVVPGHLPENRAANDPPPVPGMATNIGPGSHLIMTMDAYPDYLFSCTANFVWQDAAGNLYLGAAGHCFLPITPTGASGPTYMDTNGKDHPGDPLWHYNPAGTHVNVCISSCDFGGQLGFQVQGNTIPLGDVVWARQNGPGDDFGIVRIPDADRPLVRLNVPVWNGPHATSEMNETDVVGLYGNAAGFGEVFPTMARAGLAGGNDGREWYATIPSFEGDSGSAVVSLAADATSVLHGKDAVGLLTHLSVTCCTISSSLGGNGVIAGTTMARAKAMALDESGLAIMPLMSGDALPSHASAPGAPRALSATEGDHQVSLTWSVPLADGGSPVTGYTVAYGTAPGSHATTLAASGTSATVTGLIDGTTYYFVVRATNGAGTSADSNEASATPTAVVSAPAAPTGLQAFAGDARVSLTWSAPDNGGSAITGYTVSYGTASGAYDHSVSTSSTSTVVNGLVDNTTYYFVVTGTNARGTGPASNEASATPQAQVATGGAGVEVRLTQNGNAVPGFDWTPASYDGATFDHVFDGALPGSYVVEARLLDSNGNALSATSVAFTADNEAPVVSAGPDQRVNEGATVQLAGSASDPDGDGATLRWTQVAGPAVTLSDATIANPTFQAPQVSADTPVTLRLSATDGLGATASDDVTITVADTPSFGIDTVDGQPASHETANVVSGDSTVAGHAHLAQASQPQAAASIPLVGNLLVDGLGLSADAKVATPDGARPIAYLWSFGDGKFARGAHASHVYARPGRYTLTLTVTNAEGVSSQTSSLVEAGVAPTESYLLHRSGCGSTGVDAQWMDRTPADAAELGQGCGSFGTVLLGGSQAWTSRDDAAVSYASGSTVVAHVQGYLMTPAQGAVVSGLLRTTTGQVLGTGSAAADSLAGPAQFFTEDALVPCSEWTITFVTQAAIPAGAKLVFQASTATGTGELVVCYNGGADASRVDLFSAGASGSGGAVATIMQPAEGTMVPAGTASLAVSGGATFPAHESTEKLYLRRSECSNENTDHMYLSSEDGPDAGEGCSPTAGAAAPASNFVENFKLDAADAPLTLSPTGHVTGKIGFGCQGPSPYSVKADVIVDGQVAGSQTLTGACADALGAAGASVKDLDVALAAFATGHATSDVTLRLTIQQQGPIQWTELDSPPSYVNMPVAPATSGQSVQVAIDDSTFASGLLSVSGASSWSATWDLGGASFGPHTIYARACDESICGDFASRSVVLETPVAPTARVQVQVVPAGQQPDAGAWTDAQADATNGTWTDTWNTSSVANGDYTLFARMTDGGSGAIQMDQVPITVANADAGVSLAPVADQTVQEGGHLALQLVGHDPDGDTLTYSATGLPSGATLDPATGALVFDAPFDSMHASPDYPIAFSVTDGKGNVAEQDATLHVVDVDQAPLVGDANATGAEGSALSFAISASDPEHDALTFASTDLPSGATLDAATGVIGWTPTYTQAGAFLAHVDVTDGEKTTTALARITIARVNVAPLLAPVGEIDGRENAPLAAQLAATDANADPLAYSATGLPAGAKLSATSGLLTWTPSYTQAGTYNVTFRVSDGSLAATQNATLVIADTPRAPVFAAQPDITVLEQTPVGIRVRATSPDGAPVALAANALPAGATFTDRHDGTGDLNWTPPAASHGAHPIGLVAASEGLQTNASLTLNVQFRANYTLAVVGNATLHGSPGQAFDVTARLTNLKPESDTFGFTLAQTQSWGGATPSNVTLGAGQSATLSLHLVVPASGTIDVATLGAASQGQPGATHAAAWTLDVPVVAKLVVDNADPLPFQSLTGHVRLTHLDGTPAVGVHATLAESSDLLASVNSTTAGTTDANGLWFWNYGNDANARFVGPHTLALTAGLAGVTPTKATATYTAG